MLTNIRPRRSVMAPLNFRRLGGQCTAWAHLASAGLVLALSTGGLRAETWTNVATTGGGYLTGMNYAPDVPGLQILRSDVAGPWMRTSPALKWTPTRWAEGATNPKPETDGASGLAIQQGSNAQVMFADFGNGYVNMGLYKSINGGTTWNRVLAKYVAANSSGKFCQPVAIDPNNPAVVYWGTQRDGVWRSLDTGASWDANPGGTVDPVAPHLEPDGGTPTGARTIVIDPREILNGRSKTVYFSVFRSGVYRSTQSGNFGTFSLIPGQLSGFDKIYDMELDGDGALYIATTEGVAKYDGTSWTDITPVTAPPAVTAGFYRGGKRAFIALDKTFGNKKRLALFGQTNSEANSTALWRSFNGGTSWEGPFNSDKSTNGNGLLSAPDAAWTRGWIGAGASVIEVSPHVEGAFYILDAFQLWKCDNVWATSRPTLANPLPFRLDTYGVENLVLLALHAPKSGATQLFSGVSDVRGFRHLSLSTSPSANVNLVTSKPNNYDWSYCVSYATSEANPQNVWVSTHSEHDNLSARIYRSTDNGATFTGAWEPGPLNHGAGILAVSANDPNNAVLLLGARPPADDDPDGTPIADAPLYYTLNGGEDWLIAKNASNTPITKGFFVSKGAYFRDLAVAADKVSGNHFYSFNSRTDTNNLVGAYSSTDRGATWQRSSTTFPVLPSNRTPTTAPITVKTPPGRAGEVWVSLNSVGLWRSTNYGQSYSRVTAFRNVAGTGFINLTFGKAAPGYPDSEPIVYVYGTLDSSGVRGYFYSSNFFADPATATWTRITGFEEATTYPGNLEADRRIPGRLYVGSSWGVGTAVVNAFASTPPIVLTEPVDLVAEEGGANSVVLNWVDSSPNETGFKIERRSVPGGGFTTVGTVAANTTTFPSTGLAAYTTYVYRVRATTATAESIPSNEAVVRTTGTGGVGATLGRTTVGTFDNPSVANELNVFRVRSNASCTSRQMRVYLTSAVTGKMKLALYSDSSGAPGTLLKATAERTNPGAGWQTFTLPSTQAITAGTTYWLAIWANAPYTTKTDFTRGTTFRRTASTYGATWPAGNTITSGSITATDSLYLEDPSPLTPLEIWQQSQFTSAQLANPALSGDLANPDGDGMANLLEFATNTSPTASSPAAAVTGQSANKLTLTFTRMNPPDVRYIVSASDDLVSWSPIATLEPNTTSWNLVDETTATGVDGPIGHNGNGTRIITITDEVEVSTKPNRYLRLEVQ